MKTITILLHKSKKYIFFCLELDYWFIEFYYFTLSFFCSLIHSFQRKKFKKHGKIYRLFLWKFPQKLQDQSSMNCARFSCWALYISPSPCSENQLSMQTLSLDVDGFWGIRVRMKQETLVSLKSRLVSLQAIGRFFKSVVTEQGNWGEMKRTPIDCIQPLGVLFMSPQFPGSFTTYSTSQQDTPLRPIYTPTKLAGKKARRQDSG